MPLTLPGAEGLAQIGVIMSALRANPPAKIGSLAVVATSDYQAQTRITAAGTEEKLPLPPSNVLAYQLEGGSRIIARPSGTEPKIKFYFDLCEPMAPGEAVADAEKRARARMDALSKAFSAIAGVA